MMKLMRKVTSQKLKSTAPKPRKMTRAAMAPRSIRRLDSREIEESAGASGSCGLGKYEIKNI